MSFRNGGTVEEPAFLGSTVAPANSRFVSRERARNDKTYKKEKPFLTAES
jgi:hypothetical protein